ncbi:hypothetical protein CPR19088_GLDEOEPO_01911 [Companilactobacillus paralimentarius]
MATVIFKDSKVDFDKLTDFGFSKQADFYVYQVPIVDQQFELTVKVDNEGQLTTDVIDNETKAEYVLHLQPAASGKFVKRVANEYQTVLDDIKANCYETDIFKNQQAKEIIKHVEDTYGDDLEFLWKKFPHYAIWRRKDTKKWYGIIMIIPKSKLDFDSDEPITVMDFHDKPDNVASIVDNQKYFTGYHMNKHSWYTIILDNNIKNSEIFDRLQVSYDMAKK